MPFTDRRIIAVLLLLNAALRLGWLGVNELSGDEPFTVHWSSRPLAELFAMLRTENNPPLHFLLVKAWMRAVPPGEAWLRVPSALFSALTVVPLYLLALRLADRRTALVAAMVYTLSQYHQGFAHEVRAYALLTLLAVTGMWLLVRAAERPRGGTGAMAALFAVNVLMVYTHFFGWLAIGVQGLCVFAMPGLRALRRRHLLVAGATLLAFGPYAAVFLGRLRESVGEGTWVPVPAPEELYNMVWRWSNAPVPAVVFLALACAAMVRDRWRSPLLQMATLWGLVPLLGMFLASQQVPMFIDRYLAYAAPGFALLVAAASGLVVRSRPWSLWLGVACAILMAATFAPWRDNGRHPSRVVAVLREWSVRADREPVLVWPSWYRLEMAWALDPRALTQQTWRDRWGHALDDRAASPEAPGTARVVVIEGPGSAHDRTSPPESMAGMGYALAGESRPAPDVRVRLYVRRSR